MNTVGKPSNKRGYRALLLRLGIARERAEQDRNFPRLVVVDKAIEQACDWQWEFEVWPAPWIVRGRNHVSKIRKTGIDYHV